MAITINSTDVTNHNHTGQDIFPKNIYSENGITANTQYGTPIVANSMTDETSIYYQKNGANVWAVGKGTGGIGDSFGFYNWTNGNVAYLTPNGEFVAAHQLNAGGKAKLFTDNEGGSLWWQSPGGVNWEMDCHNEDLRIFNYSTYKFLYIGRDTGNLTSGGDVITSAGISLNALYNATVFHKIVTASFSVDNIEIAPNSIVTVSIPNTQRSDGYERELMSISLGNASNSGANSSCCTVYNQAVASGSASLAYIRNHSSSTARIAVYASVLYNYSKGASSFNSF